MGLINKLKNTIRYVVLKTDQQDKTTNKKVFYNAQVSSYGGVNEAHIMYPYGFYAVAPQNSQGVSFDLAGQPENKIVVPFDITTQFSGLKPTEVQIGNQKIKNYISFLADGSINIETPKGNFNVRVLEGDAAINITGTSSTTVSGNISQTTQGIYNATSSGNATIDSGTQVQVIAGAATLTLTPSALVSSVPITAPSMTITGGTISGMSDMITSAGKSFNSHTHTPGSYQVNHGIVIPVTGASGTLS